MQFHHIQMVIAKKPNKNKTKELKWNIYVISLSVKLLQNWWRFRPLAHIKSYNAITLNTAILPDTNTEKSHKNNAVHVCSFYNLKSYLVGHIGPFGGPLTIPCTYLGHSCNSMLLLWFFIRPEDCGLCNLSSTSELH